jgi:hypothetical protein
MKLKDWLRQLRGKEPPEQDTYVDGADLPSEPEGPYRARVEEARHRAAPQGFDVGEREVVAGRLQGLHVVHCPCGHHWDEPDVQRMRICPGCGRAVLVEPPSPPTA